MMIGCASLTKIAASSLAPRPKREAGACPPNPPALNSNTLLGHGLIGPDRQGARSAPVPDFRWADAAGDQDGLLDRAHEPGANR